MPGAPTSTVEVTNVSKHGLWLLTAGGEFFLPFDEYPWFRNATLAHVLNVRENAPGHYHWPDLDVDLSAQIIANPSRFPLKWSAG